MSALKITGIKQAKYLFLTFAVHNPAKRVAKDPKIISKMFPVNIFEIRHPINRPNAVSGTNHGITHNASAIRISPVIGIRAIVSAAYAAAIIAEIVILRVFIIALISAYFFH